MSGSQEDPSGEPKDSSPETFDVQLAAEKLLDQFEVCWRRGDAPELSKFAAMGEHLGPFYAQELHRIDSQYRAGVERDVNREILFGLLAAQLQFVPREAIVDAVRDWLQDRRDSVGGILVRKGALQADQRQLLEGLTNEQIKKKWGNIVQGIADLSSVTQLLAELQAIQAVELKESLDTITIARESVGASRSGNRTSTGGESRFRILKFEAKGGLGQVFLARDEELGREVALKEIRPDCADDDMNRNRFVVEAEITGGLEHPGIVPVYGLGFYGDGRPFYAMRFIRGDNLTSAIERFHKAERNLTPEQKSLEFRQLIGRFVDVCQAIEYAHSRGVLHRDLKPGNIMLGKYGETLVVDWGLAKIAGRKEKASATGELTLSPASASGSAPTMFGSALGTPQYMSPEQAKGRLDELGPATDVYSLGATLYHLLTGKPPFVDKTVGAILERVKEGKWQPVLKESPQLSPALAAICEKGMALHPSDRYATVGAMAQDVEKWLADEPVSAYPEPLVIRTRRWIKRHQTAVGIGSSVASLLLVGSIFFSLYAADRNQKLRTLNGRLEISNAKEIAARSEAEVRRDRAEAERNFDLLLARRTELNEPFLKNASTSLNEVKLLSEKEPVDRQFYDNNRIEFEKAFEADMKQLASAAHFTEERRDQFIKLLSVFESFQFADASALTGGLKQLQGDRFGQQNRVIEGDRDAVAVTGANEAPVTFKNISVEGDFEARIEFDSRWATSKLVGVALGDVKNTSSLNYRFLVLAPGLKEFAIEPELLQKATTIDQALLATPPRPVRLALMRGGETLSAKEVTLPAGPLVIVVKRERSLLSMAINPSDTKSAEWRLTCDDPFAPPRSLEAINVYVSAGNSARLTSLLTKRPPAELSAVEQGDELYRRNQFTDARLKYESAGDSLEAKYKTALTHLATGEKEKAKPILEGLIFEGDPGIEARRWRRFAEVKLLSLLAQDQPTPWVDIRKIVDVVREEDNPTELMRITPKAERQLILQELGKVGHRFRLAFDQSDDLKELELKRQLDELFEEDAAVRVSTNWRSADVYRFAGDYKNAEVELRRALDRAHGDIRTERLIIADLLWLLTSDIGTTREGNGFLKLDAGKAADAIQFLSKYLDAPVTAQDQLYYPLLAERARIRYLTGEKKEARADLDRLFKLVSAQPSAIAFSEYAQALHVSAFLYEEEGKLDEAHGERRRASLSIWPGGSIELLGSDASGAESVDTGLGLAFKGLAISFNNQADWQDVILLAKGHLPGSGLSGSITRSILTNVTESKSARYGHLKAPEFLQKFVTGLYRSERGKPIGREMALKAVGLSEYQRRPMPLMLYEAVRLTAYAGADISPEIEPIAWERCNQIIECYDHHLIDENDLPEIVFLWSGGFTPTRWSKLKTKLESKADDFPPPRGLTESIAYVLARNYLASGVEKNRPYALELMQFAATSEFSPPPISAAARAELETLNAKSPNNAESPSEK